MAINSAAKGSKNERRLSKLFETWVGVEFVRVPRSGGLRWKSGLMITGDTIPSDPYTLAQFPFSIETKFYDEISFADLLLPNNADIEKFWKQATTDSERVGKIPILLFRYNRMPRDTYFTAVPHSYFIRIKSTLRDTTPDFPYLSVTNRYVIFMSNVLFECPYNLIKKDLRWKIPGQALSQ